MNLHQTPEVKGRLLDSTIHREFVESNWTNRRQSSRLNPNTPYISGGERARIYTWTQAHLQNQPLGHPCNASASRRRRRRPDRSRVRFPLHSTSSVRKLKPRSERASETEGRRRGCGGDAVKTTKTTTDGYVAASPRVLLPRRGVRRPYDVTDHEEVVVWLSARPERASHRCQLRRRPGSTVFGI